MMKRWPSIAAALAVLVATCGCGRILGLEKKLPPEDGEVDGDAQDLLDLHEAEDTDGGEEIPTCTSDGECDDGDVCNGIETCDTGTRTCRAGADQPDGTLCIPLPRHICLDGRCAESVCGDCFLDRGNGEFCDDCNTDPGDGCDECRLSCEEDEDCADGDACNGDEVCNPATGFCEPGEGLDDGEPCGTDPRKICISGICSTSLCGDGFIDTGGGEVCDGDSPRDCTPTCGGTGSQACVACDWGPCRGPDESCNGLDDDCDGECDNGFECCAGALDTACQTCPADGLTGTRTCQDACEWTACCAGSDVCNGCDDDCDGDTDPPVKRGMEFPVSRTGLSFSGFPAVAWNAVRGEFGVAWHDGRNGAAVNAEIYFAVVLPSGAIRVAERRITNTSGHSIRASLVHDGSGYGLAWEDNRVWPAYHVYFVRLDDEGVPIGAETVVDASTADTGQASLAVTATGFAVAWEDERNGGAGQDDIYVAVLDSAGAKVGSDVLVASATGESRRPSLVRAGSQLAVAWQDNRDGNNEIYFNRLDAGGAPLGADVRVTSDPEDSVGVSLAWSGSEYGLAWFTLRDGGSVYFARLDGSGARIGSETRVSAASDASPSHGWVENVAPLVWEASLSVYGVAWVLRGPPSGDLGVYFARLAPDGTKIGTADLAVSASSDDKVEPALAFGSATWLVAWRDYHGSSNDGDLLAATVGCLLP